MSFRVYICTFYNLGCCAEFGFYGLKASWGLGRDLQRPAHAFERCRRDDACAAASCTFQSLRTFFFIQVYTMHRPRPPCALREPPVAPQQASDISTE